MTRAERIKRIERTRAALKRAERRHDIEVMLDYVKRRGEAARERKAFVSKDGKKTLRRYVKWLQHGRAVHSKFDPAGKPRFAETPAFIDSQLVKAEACAAVKHSGRPKRDAFNAKAAVEAAYHLLVWRGHKASKTRGGRWEKLAQALAGDRRAKVFEHIRKFDRKQPMFKKRRVKNGIVIFRNSADSDLV